MSPAGAPPRPRVRGKCNATLGGAAARPSSDATRAGHVSNGYQRLLRRRIVGPVAAGWITPRARPAAAPPATALPTALLAAAALSAAALSAPTLTPATLAAAPALPASARPAAAFAHLPLP